MGLVSVVYNLELIALALLFLIGAFKAGRSASFLHFTLAIYFVLLFNNQYFSVGRPILGEGILLPGSWLSRFTSINVSAPFRRMLEPFIWVLISLLFIFSRKAESNKARVAYFRAAYSLVGILGFEVLVMSSPVQKFITNRALKGEFSFFHFMLWQVFFSLSFVAAGYSCIFSKHNCGKQNLTKHRSSFRTFISIGFLFYLIGIIFFLCHGSEKNSPLVGAHYYSWFPENWQAGYSGRELQPPIIPTLGEYSSNDQKVLAQHINWAKSAGINFFMFDWWPRRREIKNRVAAYLPQMENLEGFKFAIYFETLDIKELGDVRIKNEPETVVYLTKQRQERLERSWLWIAKHYMQHPGYLHLEGRPALFLYATRHLVGPVAESIQQAKNHVKQQTGLDLYLIADETYFNVLSYSEKKGVFMLPEFTPDWDRLRAFDAINCYNPYDPTKTEHGGVGGSEKFLLDVAKLYQRYREISATLGIKFFPTALPGYNDRTLRPKLNHYILPRDFQPQAAPTEMKSFFSESLQSLIPKFTDSELPLFTVTTWNEWNEGSQIEPEGKDGVGYGDRHLRELSGFMERFRTGAKQNQFRP